MSDETPKEWVDAGWRFREELVPRADSWLGHAPLWHGWAIMDAFIEGIKWAKEHPEAQGQAVVAPKTQPQD